MSSEGAQGNSISGADPIIRNFLEALDYDENWKFDRAIDEESAQRVYVKHRIHDLQDEYRIEK